MGLVLRAVRELCESFKFFKLVMTFKPLAWCCFELYQHIQCVES